MDASKLYDELNAILSSRHSDSDLERAESVEILRREMKDMGTHPSEFIDKMKQLAKTHDRNPEYKPRLSVPIKDFYWKKKFRKGVTLRGFNL